jgi:hypothetical protein
MKVAIITDQHFGARKGSKLFHEYFLQFYNEVFFPTLEKEGIKTVVDMGDTFDNRRGIDFWALDWAKENYYNRLRDMGVTVHTVIGNHTAYYKNTNEINAIGLLLREYDNVICYDSVKEIKLGNLKTLLIPWINQENADETYATIEKTSCDCAMGHLELRGFAANRYVVMEHGDESTRYQKFKRVFSGHYHTRSTQGNVSYLGNPYELYWSDVDDDRGFHIFDTETLEAEPVNNPFKMFYNIYYEDTPHQLFKTADLKNKIVKVVVRKKSDALEFEKFIDKLYKANVHELKVVENFDFAGIYDSEDIESDESEDTVSILNRYIDESEVDLDKSVLKELLRTVYMEACEVQ